MYDANNIKYYYEITLIANVSKLSHKKGLTFCRLVVSYNFRGEARRSVEKLCEKCVKTMLTHVCEMPKFFLGFLICFLVLFYVLVWYVLL